MVPISNRRVTMPPTSVTDALMGAGEWIRLGLETLGALTIAIGALSTLSYCT
jgi:hypothetical protein